MSAHVAVIAGSGIRAAFDNDPILRQVSYADVPAFQHVPGPGVAGHGSTILEVEIAGIRVHVYTGRYHLYEGHSVPTTLIPLQHIVSEGIANVILTNAVGGLLPHLSPGEVVAPSDVIDMTFAKRGQSAPGSKRSHGNQETSGYRSGMMNETIFPEAARYRQHRCVVHQQWHTALLSASTSEGLYVHDGTYVQMMGPSYETRAEIRFLRKLGASTVGMSTAHETIYAASMGLNVSVVSLVTNTCTDIAAQPVYHGDVLHTATTAAVRLRHILECAIRTAPSAP